MPTYRLAVLFEVDAESERIALVRLDRFASAAVAHLRTTAPRLYTPNLIGVLPAEAVDDRWDPGLVTTDDTLTTPDTKKIRGK